MGLQEYSQTTDIRGSLGNSISTLSNFANTLEKKRVDVSMSKFETTFVGEGDFAETGIYRCGLLVALGIKDQWTFRHISPSSVYYIEEAVNGLVNSAERVKAEIYKLVAGSPYLARRIISSLELKGKNISVSNMYIEIMDGEDDFGSQEKQVIRLSGEERLIINKIRDQEIIEI
jgi:hypothetical protein